MAGATSPTGTALQVIRSATHYNHQIIERGDNFPRNGVRACLLLGRDESTVKIACVSGRWGFDLRDGIGLGEATAASRCVVVFNTEGNIALASRE